MSNPFALFRKNQKLGMAALVLLALLAFVVAPAIQQMTDSVGNGSNDNTVLVSWKGGKITIAEVDTMGPKIGLVRRFLTELGEAVVEAGGMPEVPGFAYNAQSQQIVNLGLQLNSQADAICQNAYLNAYAKRAGIQFGDQAADEFILNFCNRKITDKDLAEILDESTDGRLNAFDLRDVIKKELTRLVLDRIAVSGTSAQPPGAMFRDFKKINKTAKVEAFPVLVADYLAKVTGEPSETELQTIYDEGSRFAPDPYSSRAGFGRMAQANFQYVTGNAGEWADREIAKLSEEEIRTEYDRRVAMGQLRVPVEPAATEPAATEPATTEPATTEPATTEPAATEPAATEPAATEPAATEPAATEPAATEPAVTEPAATEPAATEPATTEPAAVEPETPEPAGDPKGAVEEADQAYLSKMPIQLVSFQSDDADETSGLPPAVVQPPELGAASEDNADPQAIDAAAQPVATPTTRVQTFEEAREEVARGLAQVVAGAALREALATVETTHMKPYYNAYRQYVSFRDADLDDDAPKVEEPTRPDLKLIAEGLGLTYGETGMVDQRKLGELPIGQSNIMSDPSSGLRGSLASMGMSQRVPVFSTLTTMSYDIEALMAGRSADPIQYVIWRTEDKAAYVPEMVDIRDELIDAWKTQKARILASESAQAIAAKVTSGENAWDNAIGTAEQALLIQTNPFSWLTNNSQQVEISRVPELDIAGNDFMQTVFGAEVGKIVTPGNQPQTVYYVTRVLEFGPKGDELLERFSADTLKSGAVRLAAQQRQEQIGAWFQGVETELDVLWELGQ